MATRRMRTVNEYSSTLNDAGGISDSDTTVTVTSVTGLPTTGDYHLLINEEIVLVTKLSGSTLTIVRGQDGTTASSHGDGSSITSIACKGTLEGILKDAGAIKTLPYGRCMRADGTILTASNFAMINAGASTAQDGNDGTISFSVDDVTGDDTRGLKRDFGTANDHRIIAHIDMPAFSQTGNDYLSFYSRQASGGSMDGVSLYPQLKVAAQQRSTYLATPVDDISHGVAGTHDLWVMLEIEWDKVATTDHLRWYYSIDGVHWWLIHTHTFAAGTCQVGIWATNRSGAGFMRCNILSWYEETLTF
jgi:hypothetical protein